MFPQRILTCLLAVTLATPLAAQTPAITFGQTPSTFVPGLTGTRGWQFTLFQSIEVTSLGLFDHQADGFVDRHQVGLWSASSTLLASVLMPAGTSATLGADSFRYEGLASALLLGPGTYRIGAFYLDGSADEIAQSADPQSVAGVLQYDGPRLASGAFADPVQVSAVVGGAFGPNFLYRTVSTVPEPGALGLLVSSLVPLALVARRTSGRRAAGT